MGFFQKLKRKRLAKKQSPPSGHLGRLSHELALQIFRELEPRDLFTARQLCSHLQPVADEVISKKISQLNVRPCEKSVRIAKEICNHPLWSQGITELVILECVPIEELWERNKYHQYSSFASHRYCGHATPWPFTEVFVPSKRFGPQFIALVKDLAKLPKIIKLSFAQQSSDLSFNRWPATTPSRIKKGQRVETTSETPFLSHYVSDVLLWLLTSETLSIREFEIRASPKTIACVGRMLVQRPLHWYSSTNHGDLIRGLTHTPALRKLTISVMISADPKPKEDDWDESRCLGYALSRMDSFNLETVVLRLCLEDGSPVEAPLRPMYQYLHLSSFFRTHRETLQKMYIDNVYCMGEGYRTSPLQLAPTSIGRELDAMGASEWHLPPMFTWRLDHVPDIRLPYGSLRVQDLTKHAEDEGLQLEFDERGAFWDVAKARSLKRS